MDVIVASPAPIDEAPGVVASPERIRAWLSLARSGDEFVYATRCWLPASATGAETARVLAGQRLVYLFQRKLPGRLEHNYVMQRSSMPLRAPEAPPSLVASRPYLEDDAAADAVFGILARAAQFRRPCPTNAQIAERADISRDAVREAIEQLREARRIATRPAPAPTLRIVTIVASGHSTGLIHANRD